MYLRMEISIGYNKKRYGITVPGTVQLFLSGTRVPYGTVPVIKNIASCKDIRISRTVIKYLGTYVRK